MDELVCIANMNKKLLLCMYFKIHLSYKNYLNIKS